jgi:hypothetical protein
MLVVQLLNEASDIELTMTMVLDDGMGQSAWLEEQLCRHAEMIANQEHVERGPWKVVLQFWEKP